MQEMVVSEKKLLERTAETLQGELNTAGEEEAEKTRRLPETITQDLRCVMVNVTPRTKTNPNHQLCPVLTNMEGNRTGLSSSFNHLLITVLTSLHIADIVNLSFCI